MENLIIKLGNYTEQREPIPYIPHDGGPTERTHYGWRPGMNEQESWLSAQGWWRLRADRAINTKLAIVVNSENIVVAVSQVEGVVKSEDRQWILGRLEPTGKYKPWLGHKIRMNNSRNPIAYMDTRDFLNPEQVDENAEYIN